MLFWSINTPFAASLAERASSADCRIATLLSDETTLFTCSVRPTALFNVAVTRSVDVTISTIEYSVTGVEENRQKVADCDRESTMAAESDIVIRDALDMADDSKENPLPFKLEETFIFTRVRMIEDPLATGERDRKVRHRHHCR
jgi:hypothetical protein